MQQIEEGFPSIPGIDNLTYQDVNTILNFQKLWIEVVLWARNFFHSYIKDEKELSAVTARLFEKMPLDFYYEFRKYYSEEESLKFLDLITRLLASNWQLVDAYKRNDPESIDASAKEWFRIADELAAFLAGINPYWDENELKRLLYKYIAQKIQEIIAFLNDDFELETRIYDDLEKKAAQIGYYFAKGIIQDKRHAA